MSKQRDVYVGDLSGGEQKRLSIAVELLDNPKILFLDEPTTHLDSVSTTQCIKFLKDLASEGRTVVCTIHQPSVKVFQSFDHIYALAKGFCIYQGTCCEIVTFLKDLDLICPPSHTPADFLLEVSNNDYGNQNDWLREKIALRESREKKSLDIEPDMRTAKKLMKILSAQSMGYEILALTKRNWRNSLRDKTLTLLRLAIHFLISAFIGVMYQGIGQEGSNILNTYKFLFFNIFVLMFTAFSSLQTTCKYPIVFFRIVISIFNFFFVLIFSVPLEFPIIKRENFNGTYTILSYFIALAISDAPILIICNLIYVSIAYILTDQPIELFRFFAYFLTVLLLSFASQGLGLIAGSMLNLKFTLILGSFFMCPFVLFSNFFIQMKDSEKIFHVLFNLSFIKHAFDGSMISIFGFNREKMNCDADYCHFRQPNKFLEFLEIDESFLSIMLKLLGFTVVFRVIAFLVMYVRLKR